MSRKIFTEEQQQLLRQNPYVYSVSANRIQLTKEFKEIFLIAYNAGESLRDILINHPLDIPNTPAPPVIAKAPAQLGAKPDADTEH